jgi:hypothetical protein
VSLLVCLIQTKYINQSCRVSLDVGGWMLIMNVGSVKNGVSKQYLKIL